MVKTIGRIGDRATFYLILLTVCQFGAPAYAAPPDVTKYCQSIYGGSTSYHSPEGKTVTFCIHTLEMPGAEGSYKYATPVDFAVACRLMTGSEYFQYIDGFKIDCSRETRRYVQEGPAVHILQPADVQRFCKAVFGPSARVAISTTLKRAVCVRGGWGPGPREITINFQTVCYRTHKTDKVRFVDGKNEDYVACVE
jgi:hypothetical protein